MASKQAQRQAARQQLQERMAAKAQQEQHKRKNGWIIGAVGGVLVLAAAAVVIGVNVSKSDDGDSGAVGGDLATLVDEAEAASTRCDGIEPSGEGAVGTATEGVTDGQPAQDVYLECVQMSTPDASASEDCMYTSADGTSPTPPGTEPAAGTQQMTIVTNLGTITADINTAEAPCTAGSFTHLAKDGYFDDQQCHRVVTDGIWVLQCGDPDARAAIEAGTPEMAGQGSPGYSYGEENLPVQAAGNYPVGTIAMANAGPGTTGSQFFIVYKDTQLPADYTILGQVTAGLDIVEQVAAAGAMQVAVPGGM
ncbi:peptidylprolyl isomerase [Glycomyces algeriensis]|uniref:Peptidyl-prolyl cis-trans isomerase n=1 Tax=Glycomyces algeriensis TaxID=256037 RepID=A0A9W6G9P3_9ACTN|nr:peptidylprolyl isomerase [Glycomyces algeriensis]MDA1364849.1 peptidylprolyl isomerase [Glycomyces algeriensis]MDR7350092.1 peptidyl-prolyl cis-trans isomerase B (cyclophilin B) [Glycomyces algeriensis]GLI42804.1 peptidyl-prolyl cis-trans isomerase [Glycomyces algeriensis]